MSVPLEQKVSEFGGHASAGSWFLANESDIDRYPELLPYAHYLRQAWGELKLSGLLCVDQRPSVYLCADISFSLEQKRQRHRFAWNQGLVPLLIFLTPNQVEVHSTLKKPEKESVDRELFDQDLTSLIKKFGTIAETLEAAQLVRAIETGQFFRANAVFFPKNETVDHCLVENLIHATRKLRQANWDLPQAHALLGRALFVSFLEERKFIKPHNYPDGTSSLLDILNAPTVERAKWLLYKEFFPRLKVEFNGTMFDEALTKEEREIRKIHLDILRDFLSGHDLEFGQMTLDFWAYDFNSIPVETISAIYEEFMKDSDINKRRSEGAYYTPRHLAETTLHVALENRYTNSRNWRVLDPACGSGIFLVGVFNLLAEQWRRENSHKQKQTKAQALLNILQTQIRGVDINADACRIAAFSLYLALFEKLKPIDVDEFKQKVRSEDFLPPLFFEDSATAKPDNVVIRRGDFLHDQLDLPTDFDLIIGNPPWDSRGDKQIALHFANHSSKFIRNDGVGCLILPSTILVNKYGTLDGTWFRTVKVERIVQLADFRFVLFKATHPCFILRYTKATPSEDHVIAYETPKLNRFDSPTGIFIVEPDDLKLIPQHDVLQAALTGALQGLWSRKFWGTPRDETFLRRLDFFPRLSDLVGLRGKPKRWLGGTGFQPHFPDRTYKNYKPVPNPYRLAEPFLDASQEIDMIVFPDQFTTVGRKLRSLGASSTHVLFARTERNFRAPMVIYNKGFTKHGFSKYGVKFFDGLRSITSSDKKDADLLRFLTVTISSRLFQYLVFHSGSNFGIGREQLHVYESLALPFPLPTHELASENAREILSEAAEILKCLESDARLATTSQRQELINQANEQVQPLVEAYFSISESEQILIDDTLNIFLPSIHRSNLDADIPSLAFPDEEDRKRYAKTLRQVLNSRSRKRSIKVSAETRVSEELQLILLTVVFAEGAMPYREVRGETRFWKALEKVSEAAVSPSGPFSYLRGFSYVEHPNRVHVLRPATMRNWCRTAALNDADTIFEQLSVRDA